jgi:hypothetical protein
VQKETNAQKMSREAALQKRKELQLKGTQSRAFGAGKTTVTPAAAATAKK